VDVKHKDRMGKAAAPGPAPCRPDVTIGTEPARSECRRQRTPRLDSPRLILSISLTIYAVFAARFYHHLVDDAYISFRYARNLAQGWGLVYNPGERVEGYTNFLWVLLLELGMKLHLNPETTARWLGLAAGAAMILAVVRFSARTTTTLARWIAPLFLAVQPALAVWAVGGLETPLFAALVTWGVGMAAFEAEAGSLSPITAAVLAAAALTRPEGVLFAALVAVLAFVPGPTLRPPARRTATWIAVFLVLWLPYFVWRWSYYGQLLPNTFYAKVDTGGSQIAHGIAYLHAFALTTGYWLLGPATGLVFLRRRRSVWIVTGVAVAYVGYLVFIGGDGLPMYRFFLPVAGLLLLGLAWGTDAWLIRLRFRPVPMTLAGIALAAAVGWSALPHFRGRDHQYVQQDVREVQAWKQIGLWFKANAAPGDSIAVIPAGAIPYFSGLPTVDMLGLNDVTIAHTKVRMGQGQTGHERYNLEYVLQRAPTYVVVGVYRLVPQPMNLPDMIYPDYPVERALLSSKLFHSRYLPEVASTPGGYFVYFKRRAAVNP
jgi:hypothetical protein